LAAESLDIKGFCSRIAVLADLDGQGRSRAHDRRVYQRRKADIERSTHDSSQF
jgi:hypothetical protein